MTAITPYTRRPLPTTSPLKGFMDTELQNIQRALASVSGIVAGGGVYNVRDPQYGATGNGATIDTASIRLAEVAAIATGGIVYFPPGRYLVDESQLIYDDGVWHIGCGDASVIAFRTGITATDKIMLQPASAGVTGAGIAHLAFDQRSDLYGNNGHSQCVSIDGTIGFGADTVTGMNIQTMLFWCDSVAGFPTKKPRLRNLWVQNSVGGGVSLFGTIEDAQVLGGQFENCNDDPVAFQSSANGRPVNVKCVGSTFRANNRRVVTPDLTLSTPHAILFEGCKGALADAYTIDGTCAPAVEAIDDATNGHTSEDITIGSGTIENASVTPDSTVGVPGAAILIQNTDGFEASGAVINTARGAFVVCTNSKNGRIHHNVGRTCTNEGYSFGQLTNVGIDHNAAVDPGSVMNPYGMLFDSVTPSTGVTADHNSFRDSRAGGSRTMTYGINVTAGSMTASDLTGNTTINAITGDYLGDAAQFVTEFAGAGSPETVVTAAPGSRYRNTSGGAGTSLFVKEAGTGNVGWVGK